MTPEEFLDLWGPADFARPSPSSVSSDVPADSRRFLLAAGLPIDAGLQLSFSPLREGLSRLDSLTEVAKRGDWHRYLVLGGDNACRLCLVAGRAWAVVAVWPSENLERFVNASVPQLAESLLAYRNLSKGSDAFSDEKYAAELARHIASIDDAALRDEESWWSVVIEQARYGEL